MTIAPTTVHVKKEKKQQNKVFGVSDTGKIFHNGTCTVVIHNVSIVHFTNQGQHCPQLANAAREVEDS